MKKTQEIDVWVSVDVVEHLKDEPNSNIVGSTAFRSPNNHYSVKARLIIELPEKKVEITESEFDKVWGCFNFPERDKLKQKLFGENK